MELYIRPDGQCQAIYSETLDIRSLGRTNIRRALACRAYARGTLDGGSYAGRWPDIRTVSHAEPGS